MYFFSELIQFHACCFIAFVRMPTCIAYGCSNTAKKSDIKRGFFQVPFRKNKEEKKHAARWLHNIGSGYVRTIFILTALKEISKAEMLNYRAKMKLRPGAVPTIFKHRVFDQINMDGTVVSSRVGSAKRIKRLEDNTVS